MKILVVDAHKANREAVATALRGTRHAVEPLGDAEAALTRAREPGVDVLIFGGMTQGGTIDFARRARRVPRSRRLFLLLVLGQVRQDDLDLCFAAGIDDFVRRPLFEDELRVRVEGSIRADDSARSGTRPALVAGPPPGIAVVTALRSWLSLPKLVAQELAGIVRAPCVPSAERPPFDATALAAVVRCTLPTAPAEVEICLSMDDESLDKITEALMHAAPTDESRSDVMGELANTAAGTFKRAALDDGAVFTLGLPRVAELGDVLWDQGPAARAWMVECRPLAAKVSFRALAHDTEPKRVPTSRLREGMVLSEDLMSASGTLIATAGTRMTATAIERVGRFIGASSLVAVASRLPTRGVIAAPPRG